MAVFTELTEDDARAACTAWNLGEFVSVAPTAQGIENSNFFLTSASNGQQREWVLTLSDAEFPATTLDTLVRLDAAGLPVPVPLRHRSGARSGRIAGAPALLAPRFPGSHPERPAIDQCAAIGRFLARMHLATAGVSGPDHPRDAAWIAARAAQHRPRLDAHEQSRLTAAQQVLASVAQRRDWRQLPVGLVHGDLFRDNALFDRGGLCAVIDFHHTARAALLFDLAVAANDWCSHPNGRLDGDRLRGLIRGYARLRPLTWEECWLWPVMTLLAALRFWLARLDSQRKPPQEMGRMLDWRLREAVPLSPALSDTAT